MDQIHNMSICSVDLSTNSLTITVSRLEKRNRFLAVDLAVLLRQLLKARQQSASVSVPTQHRDVPVLWPRRTVSDHHVADQHCHCSVGGCRGARTTQNDIFHLDIGRTHFVNDAPVTRSLSWPKGANPAQSALKMKVSLCANQCPLMTMVTKSTSTAIRSGKEA